MHEPFLFMTSQADEVKEKWNNVRACYRRYIITSGSKKVKKYLYTNLLSFLHPNIKHNRAKAQTEIGERSLKDISKQEAKSENLFNNVTEEALNKVKKNKPNKVTAIKKEREEVGQIKVRKRIDLTKEREEFYHVKQREQVDIRNQEEQVDLIKRKQFPVDEDDNIHFLLSFRNDMKKMTTSQKFDFKIGMLQMMKEIMEPGEVSYTSRRSRTPQVMYSDDADSANVDSNTEQAMVNIII